MSTDNHITKFLQVFFGSGDPSDIFFVNIPSLHTRNWRKLNRNIDCYLTPGRFAPEAETNTGGTVKEVAALVLDDVGTAKVSKVTVEQARRLGAESAVIRTSEDNHHYWFRLSRPVKAVEWKAFRRVVDGIIGAKPDGIAPSHLFRAPFGRNVKRGNAVELIELVDGDVLDVDALLALAEPAVSEPHSQHGGTLQLSDPAGLMALIPNTIETRAEWGDEICHQLWALTDGSEEGFEVYDAWSSWHESYDAVKTRKYWDSIHGVTTSGRELLVRAQRLDPEGYAAWMAREAAAAFDDGAEMPPEPPRAKGIRATPFKWRDAASFPLRDWLYGKLLIRKFISMTVAPGGVGKSSLVAVEALAQVTARNLLGDKPSKPLRVWIWNLEDPLEETERKIQTAALRYGISEADIGDRLFVDSGRQQKLVIARMAGRDGAMIVRPVVEELVAEIKLRGIDIVVVDPFVSCHELPENDNTAQDMIVKEWGAVAERGNCAVHLLDHTRKAPNGTEVDTESSRGAKAKTDAARVVRVINRMTDAVGKSHGIADPWQYFNTFHDKSNMAPPANHRPWFHLESVNMGNGGVAAGVGAAQLAGESVGVVVQWALPKASDVVTSENFRKAAKVLGNKLWRADVRATEWIGNALAAVLKIDDPKKRGLPQINALVKAWINAGVAQEIEDFDEHRKLKQYIQITGGF